MKGLCNYVVVFFQIWMRTEIKLEAERKGLQTRIRKK